jgi:flagellar protein FliJ
MLIDLKRYDVVHRRLSEIRALIAEFASAASLLDRVIEQEEQRAGISDPMHFAYPAFAKSATARRDNLKRSMLYLKGQLAPPAQLAA